MRESPGCDLSARLRNLTPVSRFVRVPLLTLLGLLLFARAIIAGQEQRLDLLSSCTQVRIAPGAEESYSVPPIRPAPRQSVLLRWKARVDADLQQGGREFLQVEVNGQPVGAMRDRLAPRLLNKPPLFEGPSGRKSPWYVQGAGGWVTPFSPDFSSPGLKSRFLLSGEEAYTCEVDVTDLLAAGESNRIVLRNLAQKEYVAKYRDRYFKKSTGDLVIGELTLLLEEGIAALPAPRMEPLKNPAPWGLRVLSSGEVVIDRGGEGHTPGELFRRQGRRPGLLLERAEDGGGHAS